MRIESVQQEILVSKDGLFFILQYPIQEEWHKCCSSYLNSPKFTLEQEKKV